MHADALKNVFLCFLQNHDFANPAELPPGLRGGREPPDQPGALRLLCVPVHGEVLIKPMVPLKRNFM